MTPLFPREFWRCFSELPQMGYVIVPCKLSLWFDHFWVIFCWKWEFQPSTNTPKNQYTLTSTAQTILSLHWKGKEYWRCHVVCWLGRGGQNFVGRETGPAHALVMNLLHSLSFYCMGVSENSGTPKSSTLIGFSIMFTIHFGGFPPIFGNTRILFT